MRTVNMAQEASSPFPFSIKALLDRAFPFLSPFLYRHPFCLLNFWAFWGVRQLVGAIGFGRVSAACFFPFRSACRSSRSAPPAHRTPHKSRPWEDRAPRPILAGEGIWECGYPVRIDSSWRWRWPRRSRPKSRASPGSIQPGFALLSAVYLRESQSPQVLPIDENYDFRRIHIDCVLRFT